MTDAFTDRAPRKRRWLRDAAIGLGALVVFLIGGVVVAQHVSDGPMGPLQGGPFRTGTLVRSPVTDWLTVFPQSGGALELQLVDPPTSRTTGAMVEDGRLYIPCDLGFMWNRFSDRGNWLAHAIYMVKRWHRDAVADGRVILRIRGELYPGQAVRVTDPALLARLRTHIEAMGRQLVAPDPLPDAPTEGPKDIWFFRIDPRPPDAARPKTPDAARPKTTDAARPKTPDAQRPRTTVSARQPGAAPGPA